MLVPVYGLDCMTPRDFRNMCKPYAAAFLDATCSPGFILHIEADVVDIADEFPSHLFSAKLRRHLKAWQQQGFTWVRLCSNQTVSRQPYKVKRSGVPRQPLTAVYTTEAPHV